jgi:hypothetical protein
MSSHTIEYFGRDTVERAIANYFCKHGVTEQVRDELMQMETEDSESFFSMVEEFLENG